MTDPEKEPEERQISINLSRNTIILLVTFLALALMIVLVFFIPVGSKDGPEFSFDVSPEYRVIINAVLAITGGLIVFIAFYGLLPRLQKSISDVASKQRQAYLEKEFSRPVASIVDLMLQEKARNTNVIMFVLILFEGLSLFGVAYEFFSATPSVQSPYLYSCFICFFLVLALRLNQLVTQYRIRKGYYGTTENEAQEIVQFIISKADDPNFPSGKNRQIYPNNEATEHERHTIKGAAGAKS